MQYCLILIEIETLLTLPQCRSQCRATMEEAPLAIMVKRVETAVGMLQKVDRTCLEQVA